MDIGNLKNEKIIEEFLKLIDQIKFDIDNAPSKSESMTNYFRLRQITKALDIIKKYKNEIKSGEDLKDLKGIGKGTIDRINEILKTGRLSEVKLKSEQKKYLKEVEELEQVIGIGPKTAYDLVTKHKIKSVEQLKKAYNQGTIELNDQILTGLKYHNVYKQTIPRTEIDEINKFIGEEVKSVDKNLYHVICGSYRRKKSTSNDIDILIVNSKIKTKLQLKSATNYLKLLVTKLKNDKFLLDDLTDKDFEIKYMGFCKYDDHPVRRIDIRYVPYDSFFSSLLYFTGSGEFNRKMRLMAQELGYKLNEYGLYKIKDDKMTKIKIVSEKDIFDHLGMEYIEPEDRK